MAKIEDGGSPETQYVSIGGHEAVYLNVLCTWREHVAIVDTVKKRFPICRNAAQGMSVLPVFDQSTFVRTATTDCAKKCCKRWCSSRSSSWSSCRICAVLVAVIRFRSRLR